MPPKVAHGCKSLAKTGKPCKAAPTEGGLCYFHANPNKASQLGRIGGRRKKNAKVPFAHPLLKLDSPFALRNAVAGLIDEVRSGELHPSKVPALASLMSLYLRASDPSREPPKVINYAAGETAKQRILSILRRAPRDAEERLQKQAGALQTVGRHLAEPIASDPIKDRLT